MKRSLRSKLSFNNLRSRSVSSDQVPQLPAASAGPNPIHPPSHSHTASLPEAHTTSETHSYSSSDESDGFQTQTDDEDAAYPSTSYYQRKLEKLARTLGPDVPSDVILASLRASRLSEPDDSGSDNAARHRRHRKRRSRSAAAMESRTLAKVLKLREEAMARRATDPLPASEDEVLSRLPDPNSFPPPQPLSRSSTTGGSRRLVRTRRPIHHARSQTSIGSQKNIGTTTYVKGREWSGEWNMGDMAHVVKALRDL